MAEMPQAINHAICIRFKFDVNKQFIMIIEVSQKKLNIEDTSNVRPKE